MRAILIDAKIGCTVDDSWTWTCYVVIRTTLHIDKTRYVAERFAAQGRV